MWNIFPKYSCISIQNNTSKRQQNYDVAEEVTSRSNKTSDTTRNKSELNTATKSTRETQHENDLEGSMGPDSLEPNEGKLLSLDVKGVTFRNQGFPNHGTSYDANSSSLIYNTSAGKLYFIWFFTYFNNASYIFWWSIMKRYSISLYHQGDSQRNFT